MTRIFFSPSSQAMLRAICKTAALEVLYDTQAWPYTGSAYKLGHSSLWEIRTLLVILPDIDAIRIMLPPRPKRDICLPAACAVKRTPLVLTSRTFNLGLISKLSVASNSSITTHLSVLLRRVFQAVCVGPQNTSRSNAKVHSSLFITNLLRPLPKRLLISNIRAEILQPRVIP